MARLAHAPPPPPTRLFAQAPPPTARLDHAPPPPGLAFAQAPPPIRLLAHAPAWARGTEVSQQPAAIAAPDHLPRLCKKRRRSCNVLSGTSAGSLEGVFILVESGGQAVLAPV